MRTITKIIFCIFAITLIYCGSANQDDKGKSNKISKAPEFILKTFEGNDFYSKDLEGKVVIIDFWATWCQPCIKEIPSYNALYSKYKNTNFMMLGITMDSGTAKNVKPFIGKFKIQYPIYMGDEKVDSAFGGMQAYPTTFIIDQNWNIYKKYLGTYPRKVEGIDKIVSKLLEKG